MQIAVKLDGDIITGNSSDSDRKCYERVSISGPSRNCTTMRGGSGGGKFIDHLPVPADNSSGVGYIMDASYRYPAVMMMDCEMAELRSPHGLHYQNHGDQFVDLEETDDEGLIRPLGYDLQPSRGRASV